MMSSLKCVILGLFLAGADAFTAPLAAHSTRAVQMHETKADLEALAVELNPVVGFYDPLNLAENDFWGQGNEATIGFLRHAEIKHGRVAMAAFVGYCMHANGIQFPTHMPANSENGISEYTSTNPAELWDQIPTNAQLQIICFIGFLEFWSELGERVGMPAHYMRGGKPGAFNSLKNGPIQLPHPVPLDLFDPFGFSKNKSDEQKARGRVVEINNGRLAQIGIMGFCAASKVPGSVPALSGIIQPYGGEYMEPFAPQVTNVIETLFGGK
mmetsp:Transcript_50233/g.99251  ORF Transcript_50233/g.99251 Transcript_50233/m.99251 type:complete len:269 (-) Transcript_50233:201-1007(-)|eukprot:CAMPEP_0171916228 /NCGR_PEP_ID=MMETSP0993-20121228/14714_1 /TAXON_ID=483369 /ORGANISM="non described non described, Strain CCMP2098" /LENGTH=268 /DNA_ID=CAMNT_0012551579 /DNA_START=115 /DNA_END=921 /DNA_ORIENTATION=-